MTEHSMIELIRRKRDGAPLTAEELRWIVLTYTSGDLPDYQMAALLMAVLFRGMTGDELSAWTNAMLHSGDVLDLSAIAAPKADKHSTGGVGDKISIPLAPMVAACGVAVPMISGRGLGHTGGTLDKLESIPGLFTQIEPAEFMAQLDDVGYVMAGQSEHLVPADRLIYALRDATGTVPSIPLISSSIMSKKLAEGIPGLVLDVKVGSGAFMKDRADAAALAETMVGIGRDHGTLVSALLTDMDQPLGAEVGNSNEIVESIEVLHGGGPPDVVALTLRLGEEMLLLSGSTDSRKEARARLERVRGDGTAYEKFTEMVTAQGGSVAAVEDPRLLPRGNHETVVTAKTGGWVTRCDALTVGRSAVLLGAGRQRKEDDVDPGAGITLHAKRGDRVSVGEPLATVFCSAPDKLSPAVELIETAWEFDDDRADEHDLIRGEVR